MFHNQSSDWLHQYIDACCFCCKTYLLHYSQSSIPWLRWLDVLLLLLFSGTQLQTVVERPVFRWWFIATNWLFTIKVDSSLNKTEKRVTNIACPSNFNFQHSLSVSTAVQPELTSTLDGKWKLLSVTGCWHVSMLLHNILHWHARTPEKKWK